MLSQGFEIKSEITNAIVVFDARAGVLVECSKHTFWFVYSLSARIRAGRHWTASELTLENFHTLS